MLVRLVTKSLPQTVFAEALPNHAPGIIEVHTSHRAHPHLKSLDFNKSPVLESQYLNCETKTSLFIQFWPVLADFLAELRSGNAGILGQNLRLENLHL